MATKLKDLIITKVALVDEGSCSDAHIKLYKRKLEGGNKMSSYQDILKSLSTEDQAVVETEITKAKDALPEGAMSAADKVKLEAEKKAADDAKMAAEGEVAKLKATVDAGQTDEDILKSANLDPAIKALVESQINKAKANEIIIKKMQEAQVEASCVAKAKEVNLIPEADTKVVELLKSIQGVAGAEEKVMDLLKSAQTLIEKGDVFKELGTGGGDSSSSNQMAGEAAWAEIEKEAKSLVVKGQVSEAKAIQMVLDTNPTLYKSYVEAMRQA